mmetsp:Transcript_31932/g.76293  ORF Transcript_31932/g.76293 Transcript_31932/m.76293 type:complete len:115 (-) Transcript_31932:85-429(-)|eukprot:CAMPEP_0177718678 /NCGR_PEP_ID=MMETSP0484_2-20121128/15705_1 /TAXON_ID=354590 /ORGANISM="Rhodomonas lens, Strain RHODO" /LENGTH=114 /DNA_ID=CAMNT_0019230859 /DNA_START=76 /DNA_END=420 /DNA_ORIENTATION=+
MQDARTKAHHLACLMASIKLIKKYQNESEDSEAENSEEDSDCENPETSHGESTCDCSQTSACNDDFAPVSRPKGFIEPFAEDDVPCTLRKSSAELRGVYKLDEWCVLNDISGPA